MKIQQQLSNGNVMNLRNAKYIMKKALKILDPEQKNKKHEKFGVKQKKIVIHISRSACCIKNRNVGRNGGPCNGKKQITKYWHFFENEFWRKRRRRGRG